MKKRILSLVLATLMIISVLPAQALADNEPLATDASGITATKSAKWANEEQGIAEVTITVKGTAPEETVLTTPTDIVLVIDYSSGMGKKSKLDNAKKAATKFAETMLNGDNVRIAVVPFIEHVYGATNFSSDLGSVKAAIQKIEAAKFLDEDAGTNIQEGLHVARQKLKQSTAKNKIIIVLTDGKPNRAYKNNATGKVLLVETYGPTTKISDSDARKYNIIDSDYRTLYKETDFRYNDRDVSLFNREEKTVSEALFAKRDGYDVYAIGFGINSQGKRVLQSVASNGMYYDSGISEDEITGVFNKIAQNVKNYCAYDPKVTDFIGDDFELATGEGYALPEGVTYDASSKTLTWNVGDYLDQNEKTLTFYVKYTGGVKDPSTTPKFETNESAKLEYSTTQGGDTTTKDIPNAEVDNLTKRVTYMVTGTKPNENKPADALVWIGGSYNVVNAYTEVSGEHEGKQGTFTFDGWYDKEGEGRQKVTSISNIESDITLYGSWSFAENVTTTHEVTFTLSGEVPAHGYMLNGEDHVTMKEYTYAEGAEYGLEDVVTATGYVFDGWYTSNEFTGTPMSGKKEMGTSDVNYYGRVSKSTEKKTFTIDKTWSDGAEKHANDNVTIAVEGRSETAVLSASTSWTATIDLPKYTYDNAGNATEASYTVKETKINDAELTNGKLDVTENGQKIGEWHSSVVQTDTTYTVTNTYTPVEVPQKYKVSYKYVDQNGDEITVAEVLATEPTDNRKFDDAASVTPLNPTSTKVTVTGGEWTFEGWDAESKTVDGADVIFTGTWKFASTEQPGETTYDVSLTISKTVENVHGTAPAETYEFVVYYYNTNNERVYLCNPSNPLTISLAEDEEFDYTSGKITVKESALNDWPLVNDVRYVYVEEIKGGTKHMTYADKPIRGEFRKSEISFYVATETVYSFYCTEGRYGAFEFTNVYNKLTDRDVTPAKVSPQLNRADHVAYIMGYPDGNVRPEGEITRAEACTIFFRLLTEESRDYYFSKTNDYTDVSRSDWFNNAISTLSNAGIVTGYADGTFRPDQPITRGEMAKIIANFARLGGATKSFTDLSGHWAKSYVELAAGNGWIAGYPDGTFGPDKKITRAETVTMINRVLDRVPAKESRLLSRSVMLTFPDNEPGEWYYIAMQEATNSHAYQRSAYETAGDEMWLRLIENVDWTKLEK